MYLTIQRYFLFTNISLQHICSRSTVKTQIIELDNGCAFIFELDPLTDTLEFLLQNHAQILDQAFQFLHQIQIREIEIFVNLFFSSESILFLLKILFREMIWERTVIVLNSLDSDNLMEYIHLNVIHTAWKEYISNIAFFASEYWK